MLETRSIDPFVMETASLLGEQCGLSIDVITRDVLAADFTTVQFQNGLANLAAVTSAKYFDFETLARAISTLGAANARPMDDGFYRLIIHPHVAADLRVDSTVQKLWDNTARSGGGNPYESGFVGQLLNTRVYESSNATITEQSAAPDIYDCLLMGKTMALAA